MTLHVNYIGSKKKLFRTLDSTVFQKYVDSDTTFFDLFAGTGTVAYNIREKYGCRIIANDVQYYAYVLNRAILTRYSEEEERVIRSKICEYNALPKVRGFMAKQYSPPKRKYFTTRNAAKIDAMRLKLEADKPLLGDNVYYYLLASLLAAADKIANTPSLYGSYLKQFKASALKKIELPEYNHSTSGLTSGDCHNRDALDIIEEVECDVLYLDPPYNIRQYADCYHILDTIAKYDDPALYRGITGVRSDGYRSAFSSAMRAEGAFADLFSKAKAKVLIMSYNDTGLVPHDRLIHLLERHGRVTMLKIPYMKFTPRQGDTRGESFEYVFVSLKHETDAEQSKAV
jgi:adenine-specific DNA-methyltransferase